MKFLYKIHSGYDGFTPARVGLRMLPSGQLELGWAHYLDAVDAGDAVWVYFHGPHKFENGVYVKGAVGSVDRVANKVILNIREMSAESPLTNAETSAHVAAIVAPTRRQVFVLPNRWAPATGCNLTTIGTTCAMRQCDTCGRAPSLHTIHPGQSNAAAHLQGLAVPHYAAFWVRPRRCSIRVNDDVKRTTQIFHRFKLGEDTLAYPFALAMNGAIDEQGSPTFDAVIPVPLSPDKSAEINRTKLLSQELSRLRGAPMVDTLRLTEPISKRLLKEAGWTDHQFMSAYSRRLVMGNRIQSYGSILLVDDVSTHGLTLCTIIQRIRRQNPKCAIYTVTAGQMVVKAVLTQTSMVA